MTTHNETCPTCGQPIELAENEDLFTVYVVNRFRGDIDATFLDTDPNIAYGMARGYIEAKQTLDKQFLEVTAVRPKTGGGIIT